MVYCYELKMCESYQLICALVHVWWLLTFVACKQPRTKTQFEKMD